MVSCLDLMSLVPDQASNPNYQSLNYTFYTRLRFIVKSKNTAFEIIFLFQWGLNKKLFITKLRRNQNYFFLITVDKKEVSFSTLKSNVKSTKLLVSAYAQASLRGFTVVWAFMLYIYMKISYYYMRHLKCMLRDLKGPKIRCPLLLHHENTLWRQLCVNFFPFFLSSWLYLPHGKYIVLKSNWRPIHRIDLITHTDEGLQVKTHVEAN